MCNLLGSPFILPVPPNTKSFPFFVSPIMAIVVVVDRLRLLFGSVITKAWDRIALIAMIQIVLLMEDFIVRWIWQGLWSLSCIIAMRATAGISHLSVQEHDKMYVHTVIHHT